MTELVADFVRRFGYRLQGHLFNRPALLACFTRGAQRLGLSVACTYREADDACRRDADFSNVAHAGNLIAGEFVIGMNSGPAQVEDRMLATLALPSAVGFGSNAADEAHARIEALRARLDGRFDLVNDYLVYVAWGALRKVFDDSSLRALEGHAPGVERAAALKALFFELRHVGGQLLVGGVAPRRVQRRAAACAAALNERVGRALPAIERDWGRCCPHLAATARRQATGLMWVGHPAMVQAGAFVFQELRSRKDVYAALREQVSRGRAAYGEAALRETIRGHVLECLRHRPPFPLLPRLLLHAAELRLGKSRQPKPLAAGQSVPISIAAALRDIGAKWTKRYSPDEALALWKSGPDKLPIFGDGPRSCIAREHVLETLVSATIGLLQLPELVYADSSWGRFVHDGPIITRMRLKPRRTRAACTGDADRQA